jgi:lipid II:glycine glycyltransferase (peptidoglycan interpeptide bridge formation enzyme)
MKPKGRYNIKLATKKGVEVKEVEKIDENIEKYYNLMLETTSRDNFN